jgi:hypothetical protein
MPELTPELMPARVRRPPRGRQPER